MKVVFMGTPETAVPTLKRIIDDGHDVVAVWTQPDRRAGRGKKLQSPPVKTYAESVDIPVYQPAKIKTKASIELFKSHEADVAVVVAYGRILSKSYLGAYKYGCVNVHFSLLPKYRGAAPVNWAIANGETVTGITTMKMDSGLDTGDILMQSKTVIDDSETAIDLLSRLAHEGADLLGTTLAEIENLIPIAQNHSESSLAPILSKEDGEIDWSLDSREIVNRIRAFQPFPRSYTTYKGIKVTIWTAEEAASETVTKSAVAGTILLAAGDDLIVACGNKTMIRVLELQLPGKRRMNTRDVLNGINFNGGNVFGR